MVSMEVLVPNEAVVRPGSEVIFAPLRAQERVNGSSPFLTVQNNVGNSQFSVNKDG